MKVEEILTLLKETRGTNAKKEILKAHSSSKNFIRTLVYSMDPYMPLHVVKVPKTKTRSLKDDSWDLFFSAADKCAQREVTGNAAIDLVSEVFSASTPEQEKWMRKILKKHLSVGVSVKTVNAVFPGTVPTFEVSLAQKFDFNRIKSDTVAIEPKLDGIRCLAVVESGSCTLYARSGKIIKKCHVSRRYIS